MGILVEVRSGSKARATRALEQAWIWSVVGYTILRFVIAWGAFSEHGANVWIFGLLDVATAWPYAKAIAIVCRRAAAGEWGQTMVPVAVAVASFFAPYAYLWFAAGEMPASLRIGLVIFVSVLAVAATLGVAAKTRRLRRDTVEPEPVPRDAQDPLSDDVLIDLRTEPAPVPLAGQDPLSDDVLIDLRTEPATLVVSREPAEATQLS